jgi:hypothetical protein
VLPWEDPALFDRRVVGYKDWVKPVGDLEVALVEQAALASWQHTRATLSDVARVTYNIHTARARELHEAEAQAVALCQRLFFDSNGPNAIHPSPEAAAGFFCTSWSMRADDPDLPARLVLALERTAAGCRMLASRWSELRARLHSGQSWHSPDKFKCVRLLGRQPIDAADDPDVFDAYRNSFALDPQHEHPFFEVLQEMPDIEHFNNYRDRLVSRLSAAPPPPDAVGARALLLELVDRKIERLERLAADRLAFDDAMNTLKTDIMGFDDSVEGERLRRHASACLRAQHNAIATIIKMRKELETPEFDATEPDGPDVPPAIVDGQCDLDRTTTQQPSAALTPDDKTPAEVEQLAMIEPSTDHETSENLDLQNKATVAGDVPQVQSSEDLQETKNDPNVNANLGVPSSRTTATTHDLPIVPVLGAAPSHHARRRPPTAAPVGNRKGRRTRKQRNETIARNRRTRANQPPIPRTSPSHSQSRSNDSPFPSKTMHLTTEHTESHGRNRESP